MVSSRSSQYQPGRIFLGRLKKDKDLIAEVFEFCQREKIILGVFSVSGAVTSCTLGSYDPKQHVYVTWTRRQAFEIASCEGIVCMESRKPSLTAHVVLADQTGQTVGGRLFSETLLFAGEIRLQELSGPMPSRQHDYQTGRGFWAIKNV